MFFFFRFFFFEKLSFFFPFQFRVALSAVSLSFFLCRLGERASLDAFPGRRSRGMKLFYASVRESRHPKGRRSLGGA